MTSKLYIVLILPHLKEYKNRTLIHDVLGVMPLWIVLKLVWTAQYPPENYYSFTRFGKPLFLGSLYCEIGWVLWCNYSDQGHPRVFFLQIFQ